MGRTRQLQQAPLLSMLLVQALAATMMLLSKIVISRGAFVFALLSYRNAIGTLFIAPFAFLLDGKMKNFGWRPLMWIFINSFLGQCMALGLYYYGLRDTTPSYSTHFLNLIPVITFVVSLLFRTESMKIGSKEGKAKALGALVCVGGAMVVGLYKGRVLHLWPPLVRPSSTMAREVGSRDRGPGTFFLVGSCLSYAFWFNAQVKLLKSFPSKYWPTTLTCLAGCIQSLILGVILDRKGSSWTLAWDLQLLTIVYSGVLNTGATFLLVQWVISQKGPTYPTMFNPLAQVFTTLVESFFMGQDITFGSVLGMSLIVVGLYGFLWGKKKEEAEKQLVQLHITANAKGLVIDSSSQRGGFDVDPYQTNESNQADFSLSFS